MKGFNSRMDHREKPSVEVTSQNDGTVKIFCLKRHEGCHQIVPHSSVVGVRGLIHHAHNEVGESARHSNGPRVGPESFMILMMKIR